MSDAIRRRYRFKMAQPLDQDVHVLVLIRYEWGDGDGTDARGFVLTESGWREFSAWEHLGPDLPHITGLDATLQKGLEDTLAQWEEKVRKEILEHPPTEHFCEHKQALCELYDWSKDAVYEGPGGDDCDDLFERLPRLTENPTNYVKNDA